jgi:hypothetical protein
MNNKAPVGLGVIAVAGMIGLAGGTKSLVMYDVGITAVFGCGVSIAVVAMIALGSVGGHLRLVLLARAIFRRVHLLEGSVPKAALQRKPRRRPPLRHLWTKRLKTLSLTYGHSRCQWPATGRLITTS